MKRLSQTHLAAIVLAAAVLIGLKLYLVQRSLVLIWLITIAIGFVLYRSGICFASAFQNMFLFRDYSLVRAILLIFIVSFLGINLLQLYHSGGSGALPGRFHSFGLHTAVGAFLFGIGMTLAGGCASGTLQRIGEGFLLFWLVLLGMVMGSTIGAYHFSWWISNFFSHKPVVLAKVIGWVPAWLLTVTILSGLYLASLYLEKKGRKENRKCR